jgi:hypothetical protein
MESRAEIVETRGKIRQVAAAVSARELPSNLDGFTCHRQCLSGSPQIAIGVAQIG